MRQVGARFGSRAADLRTADEWRLRCCSPKRRTRALSTGVRLKPVIGKIGSPASSARVGSGAVGIKEALMQTAMPLSARPSTLEQGTFDRPEAPA